LLKLVVGQFFGDSAGFVEMCARHVPPPTEAGAVKTEHCYTGDLNTATAKAMMMCNASG
jgi:U5 small nuclear ribonucleoprotein component